MTQLGSGKLAGALDWRVVQGARITVKGLRDQGEQRWIKERAEALLQLRFIDANGDWQALVDCVHQQARERAASCGERIRLQQRVPAPLDAGAPAAVTPPRGA